MWAWIRNELGSSPDNDHISGPNWAVTSLVASHRVHSSNPAAAAPSMF